MQLALPEVESNMLALPQVECPVVHHFGPGVYIREVTIPAGTIALGHYHRHSHMNIMLAGKLALLCDDGQIRILTAPMMLESAPARNWLTRSRRPFGRMSTRPKSGTSRSLRSSCSRKATSGKHTQPTSGLLNMQPGRKTGKTSRRWLQRSALSRV